MNQITKDLLEENKEHNLEGNDLYIKDKEIGKGKMKIEKEDVEEDVHIFGCINFPSD